MPALGDFEILRVNQTAYWWDGGALFGVVPKTLWSRKIPPDELNRIPLAFNCYLIRTGSHNILIETGLGDKRDVRERERMRIPAVTESLPAAIRFWARTRRSRPFRAPATTLRAASGTTRTSATCATPSAISTPTTIHWWNPAG